jgi:Fe-S-cluster containining protein
MPWQFWKKQKKSPLSPPPHAPTNSTPPLIQEFTCNNLKLSPCEQCGACCSFFLVSVLADEINDIEGGFVPLAMTGCTSTNEHYMMGTETNTPRCCALQGFVGAEVSCSIYENRPSGCRKFLRAWANGQDATGNFLCDKARAAFGLQPFSQY